MTRSKPQPKPASRPQQSASVGGTAHTQTAPPTVSARWLLTALAIVIPAAGFCCWAVFCVLFWQGSWQLLYHPSPTVVHTPSNIHITYLPVGFATTDAGTPQLQGWWISAGPSARYTALYLHGSNGNLGDTLDDLGSLHSANVNVLAFDYRGYGQSQFERPSESRWRQDAEWALQYLATTRHIDPHSTLIVGSDLGANLALEVAAAHPELAGVVLKSPLDAPVSAIFNDSRAQLVPAHLLVRDRYNMSSPAAALRIPSLWLMPNSAADQAPPALSDAFQKVAAPKMRLSLSASADSQQDFVAAFSRWLNDLNN
ncbi:MAG TPA: alpha/beta hydrolase [Terracidiphilus sp.]|nr:alpha/beta hydrolase [Terracidiphilus sp.]